MDLKRGVSGMFYSKLLYLHTHHHCGSETTLSKANSQEDKLNVEWRIMWKLRAFILSDHKTFLKVKSACFTLACQNLCELFLEPTNYRVIRARGLRQA